MTIEVARWIVNLGLGYSAVGLAFAVAFVFFGAGRIDPDAENGTWGFRLLVLPGSAALWPLLLKRWVQGSPPPVECAPHRLGCDVGPSIAPLRRRHRIWTRILAVVLPIGIVLGIAAREPIPVAFGSPAAERTPALEFEFEAVPVHGHVYTADGARQVELLPVDLMSPDVLVYWSEAGPQDGQLPAMTTTLVGKLAGDDVRTFDLPSSGGWLYLYSLGHKKLLDSVLIPVAGN